MNKAYLDEVRTAAAAGLQYLTLVGTLTLPDMCGAAETPDAGSKERWIRWWTEHIHGDYATTLAADDWYQLRCGVLHEGSGILGRNRAKARVFFFPPNSRINMHMCVMRQGGQRAIGIDVHQLAVDVTGAAETWLEGLDDRPEVRKNIRERHLRLRTIGLPPHIVGVPVIA